MKIKLGKEAEYAEYKRLNSDDSYSKGVVDFGERWADLIEYEMSKGKTLEDIAKKLSHDADSEGISGFMYGCAVQALSEFWEHGEALRCWSNLDIQIGDEGEKANKAGGILNPALITIGSKDVD